MSADKDRGIRRQKQKRAKELKRQLRDQRSQAAGALAARSGTVSNHATTGHERRNLTKATTSHQAAHGSPSTHTEIPGSAGMTGKPVEATLRPTSIAAGDWHDERLV